MSHLASWIINEDGELFPSQRSSGWVGMAGAAKVGVEKGHTSVWTHSWDDAPVMPVDDQGVTISLGFDSTEVPRKH